MYCLLIDSSRQNYIGFLKFVLENKPNIFEVVEYDDLNTVDWSNLSEKYDYTIVLSRYSYINFTKLVDFITINSPNFAGLSTYWGMGFPYVAIISKLTMRKISKNYQGYKNYFSDPIENFFVNILLDSFGFSDIKELLSLSEKQIKESCENNNIYSLDNFVYLNNIDYKGGFFHNSIFVSFNDEDPKFLDFINEYHSGKKYIKYQNKPYRLDIGKRFFVIKNYHIGIINKDTFVYWDREQSIWKKAKPKLYNKISDYITKNFPDALDFSLEM